jgi:hypothetical protein
VKSVITTSVTTLIAVLLASYKVNLSPYHIALIQSGISEIVDWSEEQIIDFIKEKMNELIN